MMHWRPANRPKEVAVQGTLHMGEGQEHLAQCEAIKEDVARKSTQLFMDCVDNWTIWVEENAPHR
eukprot:10205685-Prorocentrum_lima.AAC.1